MISSESWIIIIFGFGYAIAEAIQLLYLGIQSRKTARRLDELTDPKKLGEIIGQSLINAVKHIKESDEASVIWDELRYQAYEAAIEGLKTLSTDTRGQEQVGELMEISGHVVAQAMQPILENTIAKITTTAAKQVDKAIDQEFAWLPKKWRKAAAKIAGAEENKRTGESKTSNGFAPL